MLLFLMLERVSSRDGLGEEEAARGRKREGRRVGERWEESDGSASADRAKLSRTR